MMQSDDNLGLLRANLDAAIERAYLVFARYESVPPLPVHCCQYCIKPEDQEILFCRPLRDLTWAELEYYGFKAVTSFGTIDDFRHFLPRILELFMMEAPCRYNEETASGKLQHARWTSWPSDEVKAVNGFFESWWKWRLETNFHERDNLEHLVSILGTVFDDLSPFLSYWDAQWPVSRPAAKHLAQFVDDTLIVFDPENLGCIWGKNENHLRTIKKWLFDPRKSEFLVAASKHESDKVFGVLDVHQLGEYSRMCAGYQWDSTHTSAQQSFE